MTDPTTDPVEDLDDSTKSAFNFPSGQLYTHPNIRNLTASQLHDRLSQIRQRRLITAVEFQTAQTKRLDKEGNKLSEKWTKLAARIEARLLTANEAVKKAEHELEELGRISNQLSILE